MSINKEINNIVCPWDAEGPTKVLNSLCNWELTNWNSFLWRFDWIQYIQGKMNNPRKEASQFKGRLKEATGSKIENKFAIIFSLNC